MTVSPKEVFAAQPSVKLSNIKGEVTIKTGGGLHEFQAVNGTELVQGDWLRTGKTGTAKLSYEDGTEATIGASSYLNIQRLTAQDTTGLSSRGQARITSWQDGHQSSLELWAGSIWNKVKSLVNMDDKYEVETPTAVMGVRGTLYLVSVDPETGFTQSNVIDGAVGVTQNKEDTQATPIQLVTMGKTLKLVSLSDPLPDNQIIDQKGLIKTTQPEILVKLSNDIIERTKELIDNTKGQQQSFGQTGDINNIRSALGTSFKLVELAGFGKELMDNLQKSDKLEVVKQVLEENNQTIEQLQTTINTLKAESEQIRSEVMKTAKDLGLSQDQIDAIGQEATGAPSTPDSAPTATLTPEPSGGGGGGNSTTSLTSTDYIVSAGTITNVPYGTSKATFLSKLTKGESHQSWDTSRVSDPVVSNDTIVVKAQNGTKATYTITVAAAPDTDKPVITLIGNASVEVANGATYVDAGVTITDNKDLGLVATVTYTKDGSPVSSVNTLLAGTYVVHYNVTDAAGNPAAEVTRTVVVDAIPVVVVLKSIAISTPATKLTYTVGDLLDLSGLVVTGTYSDNSTRVEPVTVADITGFDSSAPSASQTLTIAVGSKTTSYVVSITAIPITEIGAISGIAKVGVELTAGALTPAGATASYQWQISVPAPSKSANSYADISGATAITYTPVAGDVDKFIRVVARGTGNYSGSVTSGETAAVTDANNSTISPTSATFDKYTENTTTGHYADVIVNIYGNTLDSIINEITSLIKDRDYTVSGSTVTIKKEYLEIQNVGTTTLSFNFHTGSPGTLSITVNCTTSGFGGRVTDIHGVGVSEMVIKFLNAEGEVEVDSTPTDSDGYYHIFELQPGTYTGMLSKTGYLATTFKAKCEANVISTLNFTAITVPKGNQTRIVLTWGENPTDLDSHLIGPTPYPEQTFHTYYDNENYVDLETEYVAFDFDDMDSYGPETTTISTTSTGKYTFYVENFSKDGTLRTSGAKVEVYEGNTNSPTQTFDVPSGSGEELYWEVFDMVVDEAGIVFFKKNGAMNVAAPNTPPTATPTLTGLAEVGQTLTADSGYADDDSDDETETTYAFYSYDDNGTSNEETVVQEASTTATYVIQTTDVDKVIIVKVVPKNANGTGLEKVSAPTEIIAADESAPTLSDLTVTNSQGTVTGTIASGTITFDITGKTANFTTGTAILSEDVNVVVSGTPESAYDVPEPGVDVTTSTDLATVISTVFNYKNAGVSPASFKAKLNGAVITLTDKAGNPTIYEVRVIDDSGAETLIAI